MTGIAADLGGSKATLWSYFENKEVLFRAVLDHAISAYQTDMASLFQEGGEQTAILRAFCRAFVSRVTSPTAISLHRLVHAEAGRFPEMGRIFFEVAPAALQRILGDYLARSSGNAFFEEQGPHQAAKALMILCTAGCYQRIIVGELDAATPEQIEHDAAFALGIFSRAFLNC